MKRSLLIICILILSLFICGCTASNQNALPSSKYVVIYQEVHDAGQIVSGNFPSTHVGDAYPPISFFYNNTTYSALDGMHPVNGSLKVLFGMYTQQESREGLRNGLNVVEIYDFPSTPEPGLTIDGVDKNGTVDMIYDNTSVALSSGSSWTAPPTPEWNETHTITYLSGMNGQNNATNYTYTIQYNRTLTIENKGVIDK